MLRIRARVAGAAQQQSGVRCRAAVLVADLHCDGPAGQALGAGHQHVAGAQHEAPHHRHEPLRHGQQVAVLALQQQELPDLKVGRPAVVELEGHPVAALVDLEAPYVVPGATAVEHAGDGVETHDGVEPAADALALGLARRPEVPGEQHAPQHLAHQLERHVAEERGQVVLVERRIFLADPGEQVGQAQVAGGRRERLVELIGRDRAWRHAAQVDAQVELAGRVLALRHEGAEVGITLEVAVREPHPAPRQALRQQQVHEQEPDETVARILLDRVALVPQHRCGDLEAALHIREAIDLRRLLPGAAR